MKKRHSGLATVAYGVARERALTALNAAEPKPAAIIADAIWPGHNMHAQGAGGAASRILKRMEKQGLAHWTSNSRRWGWVKV